MLIITTKTGDTFKLDLQRLDSGGSPVDVSGLTITAKIQGESFNVWRQHRSDQAVITTTEET